MRLRCPLLTVLKIDNALNTVGKETARVVLAHNAKVYLACRSEEKANAAIADLKKVTGKDDIHFLPLDLSSFSSIKNSAEQFKRCSAWKWSAVSSGIDRNDQ